MKRFATRLATRACVGLVATTALLCAGGCDAGGDAADDGTTLVAFTLVDVNPTSPTLGQDISPAAHLGSVTGWYFAHAS